MMNFFMFETRQNNFQNVQWKCKQESRQESRHLEIVSPYESIERFYKILFYCPNTDLQKMHCASDTQTLIH